MSVFWYIVPVIIIAKVVKYMRTGKDIDFTHVDCITYAITEYWNAIPIFEIVSKYVKLFQIDDDTYSGEYEDDYGVHQVRVHKSINTCTVDFEPYNPEAFITLFEGDEIDPVPIIKNLTGVDLDEFISDVTYSDGTVELLDVKGKTLLIGDWKRVVNDNNR